VDAAARLEATGLTRPAQAAAYAQMLCTCAHNAAHAGDRALEMIKEAAYAATRAVGAEEIASGRGRAHELPAGLDHGEMLR